jgi:ubiquinone/menaquinone biosynthesis C-methylase UbiE
MEGYYKRMKNYYERRAAEYDDAYLGTGAYSGRDWPGFEDELGEVTRLLEGLPPARVLDVGCGTGFLTRHLRGKVVGLDQSEGALAIAHERVPGARFVRGGALKMPFPDSSFDRVFAGNFYGVLLPPERRAFLAEARRVGKELMILETSLAAKREYGEGFQERTLSDGSRHAIYRKYFSAEDLSLELGECELLYAGDHFVLMASGKVDSLNK